MTRDGRFPVTLKYDGSLLFTPAGKISARCELNLEYFPFDFQVCNFRFESWVYNDQAVKVFGKSLMIDQSHFIHNPQWDIIDCFSKSSLIEVPSQIYACFILFYSSV